MRRVQSDVNVGGGIGATYDSFAPRAQARVQQKREDKSIAALMPNDVFEKPAVAAATTPVEAAPAQAAPQQPGLATPEGWRFPSHNPILLYNSDCSVCRKLSSWVIASDDPKNGGHQKIDERPIGYDPEALKKLNPQLDIWNAYETIHLLMPDGSMKTGGEAISEVFKRLPQTDWASGLLDFSMFGWRPFQGMVNVGYTVLDKLRPALGCESCGKPVPWWGKPIHWAFQKLSGP